MASFELRVSEHESLILNRLIEVYIQRLLDVVKSVEPAADVDGVVAEYCHCVASHSGNLTMNDFMHVVRTLLTQFNIDGLGLRFGHSLSLTDYGIAGLAASRCKTFQDALGLIEKSANYLIPGDFVRSSHKIDRDRYHREFEDIRLDSWFRSYIIDQEISASLRMLKDLLPDVSLVEIEVGFTYPEPKFSALYLQTLGCKIRFRAPSNYIRFPEKWLMLPLENSDPVVSLLLEQQCERVIRRLESENRLVDQVRRLVISSRYSVIGLKDAAARLGIPVHTFRRELYRANTSYRAIVLNVRMEMATEYLRGTTLPLQEISYLVGYEHVSSFTFAFKNFWGMSPSAFRKTRGDKRSPI